MPRKDPDTERFGGPGASREDRSHPEEFKKRSDAASLSGAGAAQRRLKPDAEYGLAATPAMA